MASKIVATKSLIELIGTEKVIILEEDDGGFKVMPVKEDFKLDVEGFKERRKRGEIPECIKETYGMFADSGDTLDKFLERKHADKELDF